MLNFFLSHETRQNEGLKPNALFGLPAKFFQSEPSEIYVIHSPHGFCLLKGNVSVIRLMGVIRLCLSPSPTFLKVFTPTS